KTAFERYRQQAKPAEKKKFQKFKKENAFWLEDYSLFMGAFEFYEKKVWNLWDPALASRQPKALKEWRKKLADRVAYHEWLQYEFYRQWLELRAYANEHGISIIGDI